MTKREIEKMLKNAGFRKQAGRKHDIWNKEGMPPIACAASQGRYSHWNGEEYFENGRIRG